MKRETCCVNGCTSIGRRADGADRSDRLSVAGWGGFDGREIGTSEVLQPKMSAPGKGCSKFKVESGATVDWRIPGLRD